MIYGRGERPRRRRPSGIPPIIAGPVLLGLAWLAGDALPCTMRALNFRFAKLVFHHLLVLTCIRQDLGSNHSMTPYRLLTGLPTQGAGRGADPTGKIVLELRR